VFYRVEVGVFHAAAKVFFAANQMFPIATLPDASLTFGDAAGATMLAARQA